MMVLVVLGIVGLFPTSSQAQETLTIQAQEAQVDLRTPTVLKNLSRFAKRIYHGTSFQVPVTEKFSSTIHIAANRASFRISF